VYNSPPYSWSGVECITYTYTYTYT